MLLREIIAVCSENHIKSITTLFGQNADILVLQQILHLPFTVFSELNAYNYSVTFISLYNSDRKLQHHLKHDS
jgi:hypothetical protein